MRVLICPDKFKGSLTAIEVCNAVDRGLKRFDPTIQTTLLPLADGGEGTLDVLESILNTERIELIVNDPCFRPVKTYYLRSGQTAYIEMALASGLQLLTLSERNPLNTSTYGTGELIKHALDHGVNEVFLMVGGSATNDGGIGMASALGYEFITEAKSDFKPIGSYLTQIVGVRKEARQKRIDTVRFTVLSDVQSLLLGPNGASYVYGEQKGANLEAIELLDRGLAKLTGVMNNGFEKIKGSGAAGGLAYGAMSFLGANIQSGIESVLEMVDFEDMLNDVDLIITGEGKLDAQSLEGKVIFGVIELASSNKIPIGIICGISSLEHVKANNYTIYQVIDLAENLEEAIRNGATYVEELAYDLIRGQV